MKTIGRTYVISCALLLSACAVEVSDEEFGEEAAELEGSTPPSDGVAVGGEVELTEESIDNARSVAPDDATVDGEAEGTEAPDTAAKAKDIVGDGTCHTFGYLRGLSDAYCQHEYGCMEAGDRNYSMGCTGWWGNGARYVTFYCYVC
jgi:hypothetical protein